MDMKRLEAFASFVMEMWRYVFSVCLLLLSLGVTIYAMLVEGTIYFPGVPGYAQIILMFVFLILSATMEGTMMAITQLRKVDPNTYKDKYKLAYNTVQFATQGQRIERFLNGRQVIVVLVGFQFAFLTTVAPGGLPNFPSWLQALLETGLQGSFIVLVLGQITPQTFAAKFPCVFLSMPIIPVVFRLCLAIEFTGITYAAWAIVRLIVKISGHKWKQDVEEPDVKEEKDADEDSSIMYSLFDTLKSYLTESKNSATNNAIELDVIDMDTNAKLPILVGDETLYASTTTLAEKIDDAGLWKLSFLEPSTSSTYVAPHIVACALMAENARLQAILQNSRVYVQV